MRSSRNLDGEDSEPLGRPSCCPWLTKRFTRWSCDVISCADFPVRRQDKGSSFLGEGAGSRIIRLPRLQDEGPMGKQPLAHPQNGDCPANGSLSGHRLAHKW
jgi:hypothetical protein